MPFRRKLLSGPNVTFPIVPSVDRRASVPDAAEAAKVPPASDRRFELGIPMKKAQDVPQPPSQRALAGPDALEKQDSAPADVVLVPVINETLESAMARTGVTDAGELVEIALQQLAAPANSSDP